MALINVVLGGTTAYTEDNIPYAVDGYSSQMEEDQLEKKTGSIENDIESTTWTEYWFEGNLVHRSVNMVLKKQPEFSGEAGQLG